MNSSIFNHPPPHLIDARSSSACFHVRMSIHELRSPRSRKFSGINADIVKVGGFKLSALEIESGILQHPSVMECCVLGLPDKDYGERVCAIIVLHPDHSKPSMSLNELRTWAKHKLDPYKLPTVLLLKDSLPRNAMGKVNKKELKKKLVIKNGA